MAISKIKRGLALRQIPTNLFTYSATNKIHTCTATDLANALGDFVAMAFIVQSNGGGVIWGVAYNPNSSNRLSVQGWGGKDATTISDASFTVYAVGY